MKRLPLLLGLMLLLAACEKDIEFNGEVTDPLMVINSIVSQDSLLEIKVTKSCFFMQHEDTFETVKNATVELHVNGDYSEVMTHAGNGRYVSHYKVSEGDLVRIVSQAPNLKTASAEMQIVPNVNVVRFDTSLVINSSSPILDYRYDDNVGFMNDTIGWSCWCTVNCKLTFSDVPNSEDFYRLVVYNKSYVDSVNYYINPVWYEKADVVFGEKNQTENEVIENSNYNRYGTFSDELFDGKNYPLTFSFDATFRFNLDGTPYNGSHQSGGGFYQPNFIDYYIDLQTLSKSYFLYLATSSIYNSDDLFAEPVQIHSNVVGGTGIVGNYSHHLIPVNSAH